ncbi:hypothetical protein VTK26DRAFT_6766 [Humicola hyalothermophila]
MVSLTPIISNEGSSLPNWLYHVCSLTPCCFGPACCPGAFIMPARKSRSASRAGSISLPGSGNCPSAVPVPSNPPSVRFLPCGPAGSRCRCAAT